MNHDFQYAGKLSTSEKTDSVKKEFLYHPHYFRARKSNSHELSALHMHNYMQLWYGLRGTFRHSFNNVYYNQSEGDFLFVPPFFPHQIDTSQSENAEFIYCDFSDEFLDVLPNSSEKNTLFNLAYLRPLITNAYNMKPYISFPQETAKQIKYFLLELIKEQDNLNELSPTYLRTTLTRILNLVAHEYETIAPQKDDALFIKYRAAIQEALNYIDENYMENIQLKTISKIALMSERSFSYVFKQITGRTFLDYLQYMRIRQAQSLLEKTDQPLISICLECGFYDTAHFCHTFKRITGFSPGAYRKKLTSD